LLQSPKVGFAIVQREDGHPKIVKSVPEAQGDFGQNEYVLLHLQEFSVAGMFPIQRKR